MKTIRQQIIDLLQESALDVLSLSQSVGIAEKEIITHLPHIAKTAAGRGGRLKIQPASCEGCGYAFKDRKRISPPSRCPRCKGSRILGPWYQVIHLKKKEAV